jgi:hypothetical protein
MSDPAKTARTWPIGKDLRDLCEDVVPGARGLDAYCSLMMYRLLEIVESEFVSKRVFTEMCEKYEAEIAQIKTKLAAVAMTANILVGVQTQTWDQHVQNPGPWRNFFRPGGGVRNGPWFRTRSRVTWTNPQGSVMVGEWQDYT